jgi:hypothetical protein
MPVERTDHFPVTDKPLGERTLAVGAKVFCREDTAVALTKDRDLQWSDDIAAALARRYRVGAAKIDLS